jgi:hypothetical protein
MPRRTTLVLSLAVLAAAWLSAACGAPADPRLKGAYRRPPQDGWIFVHLEGTPARVGFQHGSLLAPEILEAQKINALEFKHDYGRDWEFFRTAAREMMWPHIEEEYRLELQGIADGIKARGVALDLWDIVALNGVTEWSYYLKWLEKKAPKSPGFGKPVPPVPGHCSAFVATGSYTRDGRPVIAHNIWTAYLDGERFTIVFDIVPSRGHRILMDGFPGFIASGDDFGLNEAGLVITETTIDGFEGYDPAGVPEFVRARKAMQYAASIDDFARIMEDGNNGGYANDWLAADIKTGEIARLELGLKNVTLERTKDGYFSGANFPVDPKLIREETTFDPDDPASSPNARRLRWDQLLEDYKGRIDAAAARSFLADHYDAFEKKDQPNERTLCGHVEFSPRGWAPWEAYGPYGTGQNKVADAALAERMSFGAAAGHACGLDFKAGDLLKAHPEFAWQKEFLRDMPSRPWTLFAASR